MHVTHNSNRAQIQFNSIFYFHQKNTQLKLNNSNKDGGDATESKNAWKLLHHQRREKHQN